MFFPPPSPLPEVTSTKQVLLTIILNFPYSCWHAEAERRPTMTEVRQKLKYLSQVCQCSFPPLSHPPFIVIIYFYQFVELKRPLISRRQGQPPNKAKSPVEQPDNGGIVMSARNSPPEQIVPPVRRPQRVQFADSNENGNSSAPTAGDAGTKAVPASGMSTAGEGSTTVSSIADEMSRVKLSDEGQDQVRNQKVSEV